MRIPIALAAAAALVTACGGSDGAPEAPIPETPLSVTCEASAATMTKNTLVVNGVTREYYESAPTNIATLRESDAKGVGVVVNFHDASQTGQSGAASTCWHEAGQGSGFVTIFPSAVAGSWNTKSVASSADEVAFIKALVPVIKTKYALASNNQVYYTGVGQGAKMAQAMAMQAPQFVAAVAGVGSTADAEVFSLPTTQRPTTTMASWIIRQGTEPVGPTEAQQIEYWNKMNGVSSAPVGTAQGYFAAQTTASSERPLQQVRVTTFRTKPFTGKALSQAIWDGMFMRTLRFSNDTRTNGTLQENKTNAEMKLIDETKELVPGTQRRWLTYLPSNYAALTAGGKKLPLVFNLHGRNGSGHWQAVTTQWHAVGEKNGFIVVYPQGIGATWLTGIGADNADVAYMLALINELKAKYAVDPSRIYLNGVSMGAAFTNRMAVQYPELFAAIAPCYSGYLSAANYANPIVKTNVPLPTWLCRGAEEVPTDFPGGTAGEAAAQTFWRETVNRNFGPMKSQADGRKRTEIWNDGLAEFRWQVTDFQPHFWHEGEAQKLWDEMFSKYQRSADGKLVKLP